MCFMNISQEKDNMTLNFFEQLDVDGSADKYEIIGL